MFKMASDKAYRLGILFVLSVMLVSQFSAASEVHQVSRNLFDDNLIEDALDPELCMEQLQWMSNNESAIAFEFYDAGVRIPRGILTGNLIDMGNYHQCLAIRHEVESSVIEGKYCLVSVPLGQDIVDLPELPTWPELPPWPVLPPLPELIPNHFNVDEKTRRGIEDYERLKRGLHILSGTTDVTSRLGPDSVLAPLDLTLGLCIPKACSTRQVYDYILGNQSIVNIEYRDNFCRLPNDKPFVPADYVAMAIFSVIACLMIISTLYDLHHTFILKKGPKEASELCCSFSVYTNTRRLLTFRFTPDSLHCVDGIRAIAMMWVIVGHTFTYSGTISNYLDVLDWIISMKSVWLISAPITVDTFFMMSGLLIIYSTAGKLNRSKFLKNLHLFYILRYLRLFPLLAAAVLFQASLFHHMSDGPLWSNVAVEAEICRQSWWRVLLYIQNFGVEHGIMCLGQTWYLAIDMQLHWISPLVLFWVLGGRRRVAWLALASALAISLVAGSVYSFLNNFHSAITNPGNTPEQASNYMRYYYINTLTRASPFFVGMVLGYVMHLCRGRKVKLIPGQVFCFWVLAIVTSSFVIFITYPIGKPDHDNQLLDNILNSFMRPLWAAALGWMIFACVHGYGGPINWFLSLSLWKLPARLSYAMYLFHMPLIFLVQGSRVSPIYFSVSGTMYRFLSDLALTIFVSFIVTLAIDSPFSTLQKLLIGGGNKSRPPRVEKSHADIGRHETLPTPTPTPTTTSNIQYEHSTKV